MIIKKYVAKTEEEAIDNAKKELGNDVVIMNVKVTKPKGLFSFFRSKQTEVTVALEEEHEKYSPLRKDGAEKDSSTNVEKQKRTETTSSIEEKLENLQNLLVSKLQSDEEKKVQQKNKEDSVVEDSADERPEENATEQDEKDDEYLKFLKVLYNMMLDNEVDEHYANQIIDGLDKGYKPNQTFDHLLASVYQRLILKFGKPEVIEPAQEGPKVVIFIGPTGVGKTTTIAKVASQYAVEQKKKVALVTADTYRIAAAEQLRTYANIMQVPFRVIYNEEDMASAIKDFKEFDYIFVDTMGHSHRNEEQRDNTKNLIDTIERFAENQCYLVLSATTKYKDLIKIVDNYKVIADYHLIFTKLDETYTLGNLLNLRLYTNTSIAYVTCGQNVPEDIEIFNPQKTVKVLLGGNKL